MNILVSTELMGILDVDVESGGVECVFALDGPIHGLTWDKENVYLGIEDGDRATLITASPSFEILDEEVVVAVPGIPAYPHQLHYDKRSGLFHWAIAGHDRLVRGKPGKWEYAQWLQNPAPVQKYYNSVWVDPDTRAVWVVAPCMGESYIESNQGDLIWVGNCTHNFWWENGEYYTIDSRGRSIVTVEGERVARTNSKEFLRGVAILPELNVVGSTGDATRELRNTTRTKLKLYDKSWRWIRDIRLPKGTGQIREVRAKSEHDMAHNGLPYPN